MRTLKKALCIVLALVMAVGLLTVAAGAKSLGDYSDADKVAEQYKIAVDVNTQLGVLKGMSETTYEPQGTLTRAQLATIIYRIVTGDVEDKYVANYANAQRFADVAPGDWFAGYVNYAADNGYLKGMGNGKYDPNGTLTGYQALAALLRALGFDKNHEYEGTDWYVAVTKDAKKINSGIVADWAKPISREVAAQLAWNTLTATPVIWVAALGDYIGIPDEFGSYVGPNSVVSTLGLNPLIYSVFGAVGGDIDISIPAYVLYDQNDEALVTIPIQPIKTYNTKIDICDMLVDAGIPKTSTATKTFEGYQNGRYCGTSGLTHKDLACEKQDDLHGQGVVTYLFDLSQLTYLGVGYEDKEPANYLVAQTWYYLAQVIEVDENAHGKAGATTLAVWCKGAGEDPIEVTVPTTKYEVGTWLIVHDNDAAEIAVRPTQQLAKAINDPPPFARQYMPTEESKFVIDYEPDTISGQLAKITDNKKAEKITFNINKKEYDLNIDYYMSDALQLDPDGEYRFAGRTYTWFLDKFGNIIGDLEEFAATNYAVVDRIAYYAKELDNGYAAANLVYMDATKDPAFKLSKIWNADSEKFVGFINGDALDAIDFEKAPEAPSQDWWQNEKWEAPLYIIAGTTLKPIEDKIDNAEFTKGQILIAAAEEEAAADDEQGSKEGEEESATAIYANSKTQFLYRTGTRAAGYTYTAYTGVSKAPSFNNSTVYYVLAKDSKFASVVFVADNSEAAGSTMNLIIPADLEPKSIEYINSNPDDIPVATYIVYDLQGNEVEVKVMSEKLQEEFEALGADLCAVTFDADGYYVSAESLTGEDGKYAAVTVAAEDEFDGEAFIDTSEDPDLMYNFDGAKVIVITDEVTTSTMSKDTSKKLAKYFTYSAEEDATNYMFYVLKAEADKEAFSVVYVMEAAAESTAPADGE